MRSRPDQGLAKVALAVGAALLVTTFVSVRTQSQDALSAAVMAPRTISVTRNPFRTAGCAPRVGQFYALQKRSANRGMRIYAEEEAAPEAPAEAAAPAEVGRIPFADLKEGDVYQGTVKGVVAFGAFIDIGAEKDGLLHVSEFGETGFISDASKFMKVGESIEVKIKSVDAANQKLSFASTKAPRTSLSELKVGSTIEGVVRNVASFGAFIDIGAEKDGLLHVSQLEGFVADINEAIKEGDKLNVRLAAVDLENGKVTLSMREEGSARRPREKQDLSAYVGKGFADKVSGSVVGVESYGAFIELEDGIRGLLPISYMAEGRIEKVQDVMNVGDKVEVAVLQASEHDGKISFTLIDPASVQKEEKKSGGDRPQRAGRRVSYLEQVIENQTGKTLATAVNRYDDAPFLGQFGGAFAAAGIQMSENARNILRQRVDEKYADVFNDRKLADEIKVAEEKAAAEAEVAAAAEAASADAGEEAAAEPEAVEA